MVRVAYQAFRVRELRTKIALTVGLLLLYRVGSLLPAPGVSYSVVHACLGNVHGHGLVATVNLFSGGALLQLSVGALGVMPYVTASIIMQLLGSAVPHLSHLRRDGRGGQAKLTQYSRYLTVVLATIQAGGLAVVVRTHPGTLFPGCAASVLRSTTWPAVTTLALSMIAGTMLIMWVGETITERGIGNGISLLMLTTIAARLPQQGVALVREHGLTGLAVAAAGITALVAAVVFVEQGQRRIPVTYAQKLSGGRTASGEFTYLPIRINQAGVVPAIFASSLLYFPTLIVAAVGAHGAVASFVQRYLVTGGHPVYITVYVALIVFMSFFYVLTTYNATEMADDMRNAGGFIPGVRPGPDTESHIDRVLTRLSVAGAAYLSVVAVIPLVLLSLTGGANQLPLGGTSLLILVAVGLETVKQLDAQTLQRAYPDFLLVPDHRTPTRQDVTA